MGRDRSDLMYAEQQIAKYHQSVLENVETRLNNLKSLAEDTLANLEDEIIKEVESKGKVSRETEGKVSSIVDIIGTVASEEGNIALIEARRDLRHAIRPQWPYNFPNPLKISAYFMFYRDAFEDAIGFHGRKWEGFIMEQTKGSLSKRMGDILEYTNKLDRAIQSIRKTG